MMRACSGKRLQTFCALVSLPVYFACHFSVPLAYLPIHLPACLCLDSSNSQTKIWTHNNNNNMNVQDSFEMHVTLLNIQWLHLRATPWLWWTLKVWDAAVRIGLSCEAYVCKHNTFASKPLTPCSLEMCPKRDTGFRCLSRTAVWLHVLAAKGCSRTANTTWEPGSRERKREDCGTLMKVQSGSNLAGPCLRKARDDHRSEDFYGEKRGQGWGLKWHSPRRDEMIAG